MLSRALFTRIFGSAGQALNPSDSALLMQACMDAVVTRAAAQGLLSGSQAPAVKQQLKVRSCSCRHDSLGIHGFSVTHEALHNQQPVSHHTMMLPCLNSTSC